MHLNFIMESELGKFEQKVPFNAIIEHSIPQTESPVVFSQECRNVVSVQAQACEGGRGCWSSSVALSEWVISGERPRGFNGQARYFICPKPIQVVLMR